MLGNIFSVLFCSAQNFRIVVNWFYALFMCNGTSKPSVTSKPSLTIALKILKTIEKPLTPMVGPSKTFNGDGPTLSKPLKNHWSQWWAGKKNINHSIVLKNLPSLWSKQYTQHVSKRVSRLCQLCGVAAMCHQSSPSFGLWSNLQTLAPFKGLSRLKNPLGCCVRNSST